MTNIEKLKELMAEKSRAQSDYYRAIRSNDDKATRTELHHVYLEAMSNLAIATDSGLKQLIAVAEAAQLVSGDHNGPYLMSSQEEIQANEATLKKSLAELEAVNLP